jgi:molybdopterin synthase catalytic subunit
LRISVRLFAGHRERAGRSTVEVDVPEGATVGSVAADVNRRFPGLTEDPDSLVVAVNQEYRDHLHELREGDEVALIPPVSGGAGSIVITHEPLDPKAITANVRKPSNGAVITFLGTTRAQTGDRSVLHLEYEAYEPMASDKLAEIAAEIRDRWEVEDVAIAHRLGRLEIEDISLVVAVASPHRKDAFEACQHSVDRIKEIVPIWKKEYFEGGEVWIESPESLIARQSAKKS